VILQFAISALLNFRGHDPSMLLGADCMVNLQCLYLQSEFASKYYAEHCRKIDAICRWVLSWELVKHDEATKAQRTESAGDEEFDIGIPSKMNFESTTTTTTESRRPSAYVPSIEEGVDRCPTTVQLHPPNHPVGHLVTIMGFIVRTENLSPPDQESKPEAVEEVAIPTECASARNGSSTFEEQTVTQCSVSLQQSGQDAVEHTADCTECSLSLGDCDDDGSAPPGPSPQTQTEEKSTSGPTQCGFSLAVTTLSADEATNASKMSSDPSWLSVAL